MSRRWSVVRAGMATAAVMLAATLVPLAAVDAANPARVIRHGSRAEKVVALTFDDGWGRVAGERILAVLRAEKVPATFFPYALAVRSNPAFWRKVAKAGFPIGNHSWSHPYFPGLTQHEMEWQIAASQRLIESVTGVPMLRVFRPPYGAYDARTLAAAGAKGFPTVLIWDASAGDSGGGPSYASVLRGASAGTNGSVVLLHVARTVTASALRDIIRSYRARDFRFVTIPELLGKTRAPWPTPKPEPAATPGPTATPEPTLTSGPTPIPTASPVPGGEPGPSASPAPTPAAPTGPAVWMLARPAGPPAPPAVLAAAIARPHAHGRSARRDPIPS